MRDGKMDFLNEIMKTSGDIWSKGWAERNAGNISIRLAPGAFENKDVCSLCPSWVKLGKCLPNLAGEYFLVSGTGKFIRNIPVAPEENLGIIEISDDGSMYRIIWGYSNGGRPTSELSAHLQAHSVKKRITDGMDRVIIHTHPTNIIALTYAMDLDTPTLTGLLWEMHAECIVVFPEGVEFLPWMMAGSESIANATADAFLNRNLVVWQYHGIFASGRDPDTAFGLIDTAEKAAEIYFKALSAGGIKNKLPLEKLIAIAKNFGQEPDKKIVSSLSK